MASTKYADEGTIAHALAAMCLTEGTDAAAYVGRLIESQDYEHAKLSPSGAKKWMRCSGSHRLELEAAGEFVERCFSMEVTEEMAADVQVYVDMVRARVEARKLAGAVEVTLLVEQRLPIDHMTGEPGATGTGDVVIVSVWADGTAMLDLIDLKFGRGVEIDAVESEQLQMYGCGALRELDLLYDFRRACLTIHQPRKSREPSDWEIEVDVLRKFEAHAKLQAAHVIHVLNNIADDKLLPYLQPGAHCSDGFCKARATCPKLAAFVEEGVGADFEALPQLDEEAFVEETIHNADDTDLSTKMAAVDLIEDWCKAVRAEVERRLLAGTPVPGYKLVQGKRGNRAWSDEAAAEEVFKSMRLKHDEMYSYKLVSPTTAEKLLKDSPKRWNRVTPLITQSDGKPSVAPESDKRPALVITPVEDDFAVVGDDLAG
jgi:hypothetical protein